MCMACGLVDHEGNQKQYSRNSGNSVPSMRNAYGSQARQQESQPRRRGY
jgi:hypothetical protein